MITAIVLTRNEEIHLARCLKSLKGVVDDVVVVDCFSTDRTVDVARSLGARVLQHPWTNYATQFNWALNQLDPTTQWVLRIDADEVVTAALAKEIGSRLGDLSPSVHGVFVNRGMRFRGQAIRYGGLFPMSVLRLFRYGLGRCENRWMDEHVVVPGETVRFLGALIDENLNSLTWWTEKHNSYSSREVVDLLNLRYKFLPPDSISYGVESGEPGRKRWLKEKLYARLPAGARALGYFLYRYLFRLGFLDGRGGAEFHVLQGFWYRYLVDAKMREVESHMSSNNVSVESAIESVLGIKLLRDSASGGRQSLSSSGE